ncbi:MAG: hypothetical protein P1Q69_18075 [Candidatus Thorarchaeota archaeon]|nr:hypothetical protein [Candidatus Thorarchaeota archaeon]
MTEWKDEILRHMWEQMKLDECLIHDSWLFDGDWNQKIYAFPNGIQVKCNLGYSSKSFAELEIDASIELKQTLQNLLDQNIEIKTKKKDKNRIIIEISVKSNKDYMWLLWELFTI